MTQSHNDYGPPPQVPLGLFDRLGFKFVLILAVFCFLACYPGIIALYIAFAVWTVDLPLVWEFQNPLPIQIHLVFFHIFTVIFFLKPLYHFHREEIIGLTKIEEFDCPEFYKMLRAHCKENALPFPTEIYCNFTEQPPAIFGLGPRSLLFPSRFRLLIGMGLVNAVTLEEFKASLSFSLLPLSQKRGMLERHFYFAREFTFRWLLPWRTKFDPTPPSIRPTTVSKLLLLPFNIVVLILRIPLLLLGKSLLRVLLFDLDYYDRAEYTQHLAEIGNDRYLSARWNVHFAEFSIERFFHVLIRHAQQGVYSDDILFNQRVWQVDLKDKYASPPGSSNFCDKYNREAQVSFTHTELEDWVDPVHLEILARLESDIEGLALSIDDKSPPAWTLFKNNTIFLDELSEKTYATICGDHREIVVRSASDLQERIDRQKERTTAQKHDPRYLEFFDEMLELDRLEIIVQGASEEQSDQEIAEMRRSVDLLTQDHCSALVSELQQLQYQKAYFDLSTGLNPRPADEIYSVGQEETSPEHFDHFYNQALTDLKQRYAEVHELLILYFFRLAKSRDLDRTLLNHYRFELRLQTLVSEFERVSFIPEFCTLFSAEYPIARLEEIGYLDIMRGLNGLFCIVLGQADQLNIPKIAGFQEGTPVSEIMRPKGDISQWSEENYPEPFLPEISRQIDHCNDALSQLRFANIEAILQIMDQLDPLVFPANKSEDQTKSSPNTVSEEKAG